MKLFKRAVGRATSVTIAAAVFSLPLGSMILSGCHGTSIAQTSAVPDNSGPDPAAANLAPVDPSQNYSQAAVAPGTSQSASQTIQNESIQSARQYQQGAAAPAQQGPPADRGYDQQSYDPNYDQQYEDQVDAGQAALETNEPPPALPEYDQPEAPGPNYIWTPGYWYWAPAGYYWVPGAWVLAPYPGALWTPSYWGWYGGYYRFHHGYWGLHIGFYGGINYGFGYTGYGYYGGYWNGNNFYYNRSVNRINITRITNVYNRSVVVNNQSRVAYNGGRGGIAVRPRPAEVAAMRSPRTPMMTAQVQQQRQASENRAQFYSQNRGRPAMPVAAHPLAADRGISRPAPTAGYHSGQPNQAARPEYRPGQTGQPNVRQGAPSSMYNQETRPGGTVRPDQRTAQPIQNARPEVRPGQPQPGQQVQPGRPEYHSGQPGQSRTQPAPQPYVRPDQPQTRPQAPQTRTQYNPGHPDTRPVEPRLAPQVQPAPQRSPEATRPQMQPQSRPSPQAQPHPQAMPQSRPAPAPESRPAPAQQPHGEPHGERGGQPHGEGGGNHHGR